MVHRDSHRQQEGEMLHAARSPSHINEATRGRIQ